MRYVFSLAVARPVRACAVLALVLYSAFGAPAIFATAAVPTPTIELNISKFAFMPKEITIAPGTMLAWTNRDETPHNVASSDKSCVSKGLDTDDMYAHALASEGDYNYICNVHVV